MSEPSAAALLGVLADERTSRELTRSVVEVARSIFGAKAASIVLLDEAGTSLVFEAVAGEGADALLGTSYPADRGIAGWVLAAGQAAVVGDVRNDPRFARDVAEGSGFVPEGIMAVPLVHEDEPLGVLSVLDRPDRPRFELGEAELLERFADQAALALTLLRSARRGRRILEGGAGDDDPLAVVARLGATVERLEGRRRRDGVAMLQALERLLAGA